MLFSNQCKLLIKKIIIIFSLLALLTGCDKGAFTGQPQFGWQTDLADLKKDGDRAFCQGVNLFMLHASAHQPWPHVKPGMTMGWRGTQFGPSQTWWHHGAKEWIDYIARCQLLLQEGLFESDLCYLQLFINRVTFCTMDFFEKDTPLLPSGLIGPVKISIEEIWKLK